MVSCLFSLFLYLFLYHVSLDHDRGGSTTTTSTTQEPKVEEITFCEGDLKRAWGLGEFGGPKP